MSEENKKELTKELKHISTLYNLENPSDANAEKKAGHKLPNDKTLQDELNDISRLYQL